MWTTAPNLKTGATGDPQATILTPALNAAMPDQDTDKAAGLMRYRHTAGVNASFANGHTKFSRQGASHLYQWDPDSQTR